MASLTATATSPISLENIAVTESQNLAAISQSLADANANHGKITKPRLPPATTSYMRSEYCPELEDKYLLNQHEVCCTPCEFDASLFHVSAEHIGILTYRFKL